MATSVAIAGMVEEFVFRGLLLERFRQQQLMLLGSIMTTFWFVMLHIPIVPAGAGGVFFIGSLVFAGVLFSVMTLRFGSWFYAGLVHGSYNFCMILLLVWLGMVW